MTDEGDTGGTVKKYSWFVRVSDHQLIRCAKGVRLFVRA